MSQGYASGKSSIAFCDFCGFQVDYKDLKSVTINMQLVNWRVCPTCWEPDQPQYWVGRTPIYDPQALLNPRPDNTLVTSRSLFGWNPIGNIDIYMEMAQGQVTVSIT